jgi:aquaporin Z
MATPDRPLHGAPFPRTRLHPRLYLAELIGTALLVCIGLSIVILLFGTSTAGVHWSITAGMRRAIAGALFGTTGTLIALSPVGRISGAHINPAVTLAFWISGKLRWRDVIGYGSAQFSGALLGACPLLAWGARGASVHFGATSIGTNVSVVQALAGESIATAALILAIFVTSAHRSTRQLTPWTMPPLFAWLVWWEAPLSGASANPARSFGPAVVAADWNDFWIYLAGPAIGVVLALLILRVGAIGHHEVKVARLYHFEL